MPEKILIIDDEKEFASTLSERLNIRHYPSVPVFSFKEALNYLKKNNPDVILLDYKLPGIKGLEGWQKLKKLMPDAKIFLLTGHININEEGQINHDRIIIKPVDIEKLIKLINNKQR